MGRDVSFIKRKITLTFQLGQGAFGQSGSKTLVIPGLRCRVSISDTGGPSLGQANVRVFGMTLEHMNALAQIMRMPNGEIQIRKNQIFIEAGDDTVGMSRIFQGQITSAPIDLCGQPDSVINFTAFAGGFEAVQVIPPTSYPGGASVAVIMQNFAMLGNYAFENNGVTTMLNRPYFPGTLGEQIMRCAEAAGIEAHITNGTLAIWPRGQARTTPKPIEVSPATGMVGYPVNWNQGIAVRMVFNPQILLGRQVLVKSILPFANGVFTCFNVGHDLESEQPGGDWFTAINGFPVVT